MQEKYFDMLMKVLKKTTKTQDIPVSAMIVAPDGYVVSVAWNTKNKEKKISSHAEINAINSAIKKLKSLNLENFTLLSTLEPCEMCYGALKQAKITNVEYLVDNFKFGINNVYSINDIDVSLKKTSTREQEEKYQRVLESFFRHLRGY